MFGYKNPVGIDREHGFVRRFAVTHAAAHEGAQLGAVFDPGNAASSVWDDTACPGYLTKCRVDGGCGGIGAGRDGCGLVKATVRSIVFALWPC
jgi:hypothetical protein